MRWAPSKLVLLAAGILMLASASFANVIDFSGLPGNGTAIPNGYAGMNWNNFYDMSMLRAPGMAIQTSGASSANGGNNVGGNVAYNNAGMPASFSSANPFTFSSAWFTSNDQGNMMVRVVGLLNGNVVDTTTFQVGMGAPQQEIFNWSGIDQVRFETVVSSSSNTGIPFFLDSLVIDGAVSSVPEPASFLLLGSGLGLAITRLRKSRSNQVV